MVISHTTGVKLSDTFSEVECRCVSSTAVGGSEWVRVKLISDAPLTDVLPTYRPNS